MYAIYQEQAESHQIKILASYQNYSEANFHLNQTVIDYVEKIRADRDQDIMMGFKLTEEAFLKINQAELLPGHHLVRSTIYPNRIYVYLKSRKVVPGYLWNGETFEVKQIMWFGILELKTTTALTHHDFESINQKEVSQSFKHHGGQVRLIEELKEAVERRKKPSLLFDETGNLINLRPKALGGNEFAKALTDYIRTEMPQLVNGEFADSSDSDSECEYIEA